MPMYEFENTENGELYELLMKIEDKEKYLKKNPHIKQRMFTAPATVGGHGDRVKVDAGFKEVLSKVGEAYKGSDVDKRYNGTGVKESQTRAIVKKHMDIQSKKK
tara:strand:+ start:732 stop:1043 length:312 start_codon:yes stop_codon:yes gene_type:complete